MPDAVEDGEGAGWRGDTGIREVRAGLVGLVDFFMVVFGFGWKAGGNQERAVGPCSPKRVMTMAPQSSQTAKWMDMQSAGL